MTAQDERGGLEGRRELARRITDVVRCWPTRRGKRVQVQPFCVVSPRHNAAVESLSGSAVPVVESAEIGRADHGAIFRRRHFPGHRRVPVQRLMWASRVVVFDILVEDSLQVVLVEDEDVVQAFPADRSDNPLDISVLPW